MEDVHTMHKCYTILQNRERLVELNISDYPTLKQKGRNKLHKQFYSAAFPADNSKTLTTEDFAKFLTGKGKLDG